MTTLTVINLQTGGSFKSWKRRWFILKGDKLYYFKTKKVVEIVYRVFTEQDDVATGVIDLTGESYVKKEKKNKQGHAFAVGTLKRVFFMYPDNPSDTDHWVKAISNQIDILKGNKGRGGATVVTSPTVVVTTPTVVVPTPTPEAAKPAAVGM
jgi:hypothetical protein